MTVFDIIFSISSNNEMIFSREEIDKYYNPFFVVEYFSKFPDTIFVANEINSFKSTLSKYDHYLYMHHNIRKTSRSYKFKKKDVVEEEKIKIIMDYFEYTREKAKEMLNILTDDNIVEIREYFLSEEGGVIKGKPKKLKKLS